MINVPQEAAGLLIHTEEPLNAGTPLAELSESFITPPELFFVRNHGNVPEIDPSTYFLSVTGLVENELSLSLAALQTDFASLELVATIQCAGNRREELKKVADMPGELPWGSDGISTAIWKGVPLRAVLEKAAINPAAQHVAFQGLDIVERHERKFGFGGSIELEKAQSLEVLLAYEMNGKPLTALHGFPLRLVVPGYIGARSIKWLANINLQAAPSDNYFQSHAYKLFPSNVNGSNVDWDKGQMLSEFRLNSAICQPAPAEIVTAGKILFKGYAIAPSGSQIERVELSTDGGQSWQPAQLGAQQVEWTWTLWQHELELAAGQHEVIVRAFTSAGHSQPETIEEVWNFKGYLNNAWHRIQITAN